MLLPDDSRELASRLMWHADLEHEARMVSLNSEAYRLRPKLSIDGNQWCALYGDNLQDGVAGFGGSPAEAYANFDVEWNARLTQPTTGAESPLSKA